MTDSAGIERTLTERLKSRLEQGEINQPAEIIVSLSSSGIEVDDAFPYGISQPLDAISVRGHLTADQLSQLAELIPKLGVVKDYRIFPRGISHPSGIACTSTSTGD